MFVNKLQKELVSYSKRKKAGLRAGLRAAAEFLLEKSLEIVPRQTGKLAKSGYVKEIKTRSLPTFVVGYKAEYAIHVHERLDLAHGSEFNKKHADKINYYKDKHPVWFMRGSREQAKFLEQPARDHRQTLRQIIRSKVKEA